MLRGFLHCCSDQGFMVVVTGSAAGERVLRSKSTVAHVQGGLVRGLAPVKIVSVLHTACVSKYALPESRCRAYSAQASAGGCYNHIGGHTNHHTSPRHVRVAQCNAWRDATAQEPGKMLLLLATCRLLLLLLLHSPLGACLALWL